MSDPSPIDLVRELRAVLGLPSGALPITPRQAWEEALGRVREAQQERRNHGLKARHETREARAVQRQCVFCTRISRGEYDKEWPGFSFEPLNPVAPGHRLFVPGEHVVDASQNPAITGKVFAAAAEYARRQGTDFNLITSGGSDATQTVFHLHVHYVPREEGDGLTLPWTAREIGSRDPQ